MYKKKKDFIFALLYYLLCKDFYEIYVILSKRKMFTKKIINLLLQQNFRNISKSQRLLSTIKSIKLNGINSGLNIQLLTTTNISLRFYSQDVSFVM